MSKVTQIEALPRLERPTRVAAYARVSTDKDAMLNSLSQQISYYSKYIQNHPGWTYAGVYADEAKTGTKEDRPEFQRMLSDCRAGRIDMVITKSISRFGRNTVTNLNTVRELKALGIDVFFQEQNLHSIGGDGELLLTILSSYAQAESLAVSENQKWRIRHAYEQGKLMNWRFMFGYDISRGKIEINEREAEIVREIFDRAISGESLNSICKDMEARGVPRPLGGSWHGSRLREILSSEKYLGNAILQKRFSKDHLEKKLVVNNGELPKYIVTETHPAIVEPQVFDAAQNMLRRIEGHKKHRESAFTGKILCPHCGLNYKHISTNGTTGWNCRTYYTKGKRFCRGKKIPDDTLQRVTASVLGLKEFDATLFDAAIDHIEVPEDNILKYIFRDGHTETAKWQDRSRRESWTPEARQAAREAAQRRKHG